MKKVMKRIIIAIMFFIGILLLICENVNASTITLDYNTSAKSEPSKNLKIYPGDDIYISISIDEDENEKIMAMYGNIEYDKEILELVPSEEDKEKGEISINNGWSTGNIFIKNGRFMLYAQDENRDNIAAYIKFKVKEEINIDSTNIVVKDLVVYNNNYKEVSRKIDDISLEVKLHKNKRLTVGAVKAIVIMIIIIVCVILIFIMVKKGKIVVRKVSDNETNSIQKTDKVENKTTEEKTSENKTALKKLDKNKTTVKNQKLRAKKRKNN